MFFFYRPAHPSFGIEVKEVSENILRMFISKDTRKICRHCGYCRWCMARNWRDMLFKVRQGPSEFLFCDACCAAKFVKYRHVIGVAHILKMSPTARSEVLKGQSIDDYISKEVDKQCELKH